MFLTNEVDAEKVCVRETEVAVDHEFSRERTARANGKRFNLQHHKRRQLEK
jgi:hypothetical protein